MEDDKPEGPVMLVATGALKPPPLRIGKITDDFVLPRTVPVKTLAAAAAGGLLGLAFFGAALGFSLRPLLLGVAFGSAVGVALVSYSPLRGESFFTWLGLRLRTARRDRVVEGRRVRLAVGVCRIPDPNVGLVRILPGAVPVPPGSVDERGAFARRRPVPPAPPPVRLQGRWRQDPERLRRLYGEGVAGGR